MIRGSTKWARTCAAAARSNADGAQEVVPGRATQTTKTGTAYRAAVVVPGLLCALAVPGGAAAQERLGEVLSFLLTNRSIVTDDFQRDEAAALATRDALSRALQIELATLPVSSSSGGFTYRFNPAIGTTERSSDSFGSFFVERALTAGRGQASFGVNVRYAQFEAIDGNDLENGSFVTTANVFTDEAVPFDLEALTLRLEAQTLTVFASVGATDRIDLGVAVPIVRLRLEGSRTNVFRGQSTLQARASAEVVGLADLAIRGKIRLVGRRASGLALAGEVRVPTGAEEDLLGAGRTAFKGTVIASAEGSRVGAHLNVGYGSGGVSDEIDLAAGLTVAATARFTLVAELFGRELDALGRLEPVALPHPTIRGVNTIRLAPASEGTRTAFAVGGFKWNIGSSWLLNGNLLVPLTDRGLKANLVPAVALDYSFGR